MSEFLAGVEFVKQHIQGFEVRYKNENWTSKLIAVLVWIFNRRYMTDFTTTRYPRVYFPSREFVEKQPRTCFKILMHEFVHLWDRKHDGFRHNLGYLFPQWIAIPALILGILLVIFIPHPVVSWVLAGVCWLVTLVCALPLPSYPRSMLELRGYSMNMALNYWKYGSFQAGLKEWIAKYFTGWEYYKMWPWEDDVLNWLEDAMVKIRYKAFGISSIGRKNGRPYELVYNYFYLDKS